ncbi:MAG: PadR family transcriptional regulator [Lachnospiraceae bacterium]|nr:PadR family transcriptional regulator [Lachnospiraceae bacterium]
MGRESIEGSLTMEMKRGTLVLCVLSLLDEPVYGYSLVSAMQEKGIAVDTNTLYPLLRRLSSQGLLTESWDTSSARPRKYYRISEEGRKVRREILAVWRQMSAAVNKLTETASKKW